MLDRYDVRVPARMGGKSVVWQPDIVLLLTNKTRAELDKWLSDPALLRRFSLFFDWSDACVPPSASSGPIIITPHSHALLSPPVPLLKAAKVWHPPVSERRPSSED